MITHPKPLRFYAELYVERPPSIVWSFFSDLAKWSQWSPICRQSRLLGNEQLETGAILQLSFNILSIPITVPTKLVAVHPHSVLSWQGKAFGIETKHTYRFRALKNGTLITNEELYYGVRFPFNHFITVWYKMSRLSSRSLQGIKQALEPEMG
jgi:ligand-binding SRPBCC domain-containing protein